MAKQIIIMICGVLIITCIIVNIMSFTTYTIHRHKLKESDKCFYESECKEIEIYGEMKEICYPTGCDYMKKWDEYDEWREEGITSFLWRLLDRLD